MRAEALVGQQDAAAAAVRLEDKLDHLLDRLAHFPLAANQAAYAVADGIGGLAKREDEFEQVAEKSMRDDGA